MTEEEKPSVEEPKEVKFATPEEFTAYYTDHIGELGKMTTQKLNKMFSVEGHHIGRKKDELVLKKWCGYNKYYKPSTKTGNDELADRITVLELRLEELVSTVNQLIEELNYL